MTDLDSTFEEYTKNDYSFSGGDQFEEFVRFVKEFEKTFNCEVKIHFISGVGKSEIKERLSYFKARHPNSIYKMIDESVVDNGYIVNKFGQSLIDATWIMEFIPKQME